MSLPNTTDSTPKALPVETGGALASAHLQWVQTELNRNTAKLDELTSEAKHAADARSALTADLAVLKNDVGYIRDGITEIKGAQITEASLLAMQNQMMDRMHAMQTVLVAQVVAAKEAAANDLRQHEERARAGRRWVVGVLIPTAIGVAGLVVRLLFF